MPHFHVQRIQIHDPVDRFQRPVLPRLHLFVHRFGDLRNQARTDLHPVHLLEVAFDFARRHTAGVHRDDLVVESREPRLMFGQNQRLKRADSVAGNFDLQFSEFPFDRLAAGPVPRISALVAHRVVFLVSQVMRQLGVHGSFQHRLHELFQQSVLSDDVFRLLIILQQLVD